MAKRYSTVLLAASVFLIVAFQIAVAQTPGTASAPIASAPIQSTPQGGPPAQLLQVPKSIEIKLTGIPEPSGGPGWMGSAVIGAILAALASIATTVVAADKRTTLESALQQNKHSHETELAELSHAHTEELRERDQKFEVELKRVELEHQRSAQHASLTREDQKIATERQRLRQQTDASDLEIEVAIARLARERDAEVARLVHLFFDHLTSDNAVHRELALGALSEFVDAEAVRKTLAPTPPATVATSGAPVIPSVASGSGDA